MFNEKTKTRARPSARRATIPDPAYLVRLYMHDVPCPKGSIASYAQESWLYVSDMQRPEYNY